MKKSKLITNIETFIGQIQSRIKAINERVVEIDKLLDKYNKLRTACVLDPFAHNEFICLTSASNNTLSRAYVMLKTMQLSTSKAENEEFLKNFEDTCFEYSEWPVFTHEKVTISINNLRAFMKGQEQNVLLTAEKGSLTNEENNLSKELQTLKKQLDEINDPAYEVKIAVKNIVKETSKIDLT